jgi:hypothetical protein
MRYVLLLAGLLVGLAFLGCNDGEGDGDADADVEVGCGDVGQACNLSTDCPEMQVCHGHVCGCAFDREYDVVVVSAAVYARTATGNCWDGEAPHCEDPDVYAVVQVADTTYTTETINDNIYPIWNESFPVFIDDHTTYGAWLYDADPAPDDGEDDTIFEFPVLMWFLIEDLRSAGMHICTSGGTQTCLDLLLVPR